MEFGGRGDCIAMDIVGGRDSLFKTARCNSVILTINDCFSRFALAIALPDQTSETIIAAVISHYIMVYGTPRRILTDQGRAFALELFHHFCILFRIAKIRTSGYRPQSNGICERFNQTLKHFLQRILSFNQQVRWDQFFSFAVFTYNT